MTKWILDTDHYSLIQRNNPEVVSRFQEIAPREIYLTIITVQEQIKGRFKNIDEAKNSPKLIVSYGFRLRFLTSIDYRFYDLMKEPIITTIYFAPNS